MKSSSKVKVQAKVNIRGAAKVSKQQAEGKVRIQPKVSSRWSGYSKVRRQAGPNTELQKPGRS